MNGAGLEQVTKNALMVSAVRPAVCGLVHDKFGTVLEVLLVYLVPVCAASSVGD